MVAAVCGSDSKYLNRLNIGLQAPRLMPVNYYNEILAARQVPPSRMGARTVEFAFLQAK